MTPNRIFYFSQTVEREKQAAIEEDTKLMEKLANKKSLLLKKVWNFFKEWGMFLIKVWPT